MPDVAPCPSGQGPEVACERGPDGACGWQIGRCGSDCGGFVGVVCSDDEYCDFPDGAMCGAADQSGLCAPRPLECPPIDGLVCACDGSEYESPCAAAAAGADVAFEGPCAVPDCPDDACGPPPPVARCPGGGGPPMSCDPGRDGMCFWNIGPCPPVECTPDLCGPAPRVAPCPNGELPAVSCDADADGACNWSVAECPPASVGCGGRAGNTCTEVQFCDFAGDGCDFADAQGTCQARPEACNLIFAPVCGCNGVTYDNLCIAQAAGVDAAASGPCAN